MNQDPTKSRALDAGTDVELQPSLIVLHYVNESLNGLRLPLKDTLLLGRAGSDGEHLALSLDQRASKTHARITRSGTGFIVSDLSSKNGTFVNGVRVTEASLVPGDVLRIGDSLFELALLEPAHDDGAGTRELIGTSPAFRGMMGLLNRLAQTTISVLLAGESGTGKELLARFLHERSGRKGELIAVNCAAIPEALFESAMFGHVKGSFTGAAQDAPGAFAAAKGGTLFLDEIGEMPLAMQPKLLRVLETGDFTPVGQQRALQSDARVVAATNAAVEQSDEFRRDLFARFSAGFVKVPPLRERKADIVPLALHFLNKHGVKASRADLSPDVCERLLLAPWPLNVRELSAVMQRAALETPASVSATLLRLVPPPGPTVAPASPPALPKRRKSPPAEPMTEAKFREAVTAHGGNVVRIAKALGHDRKQVYRWAKQFGVDLRATRS